ncbi:DUF6788 family protein [Dictyobacter aurantiacus]|uniref:Bacterial transcriptional activator domain-containing protein n=1 Tax=Dictyobacter aurantiacus TaxID=1936993 RepID=A0A401Z7X6_9CHLR|nr:DUF6788 family protein [Dictyobacter aurantiacus]GCE02967.1 hypothetical protein KDAU_02960 [Dictyobacter aurantiacus]
MNGKVTYRQQFTRCGKERCRKCKEGSGHGPYWYAYWSVNGRTVSKYIGTNLPEAVKQEQLVTTTPSTASSPSGPLLRVYVLGQFRIERKMEQGTWQPIDGRLWHRRRARSLLGCLLSSPNRRLSREQVMDQLWPDLEIDIAANRLNGAVHELRQMLEPDLTRPAASRLLKLERDVLELAGHQQIWVDAEAFENLIKEADTSTDPVRTRQLQEEAANLYRGSYLLEELYSEWAGQRRDALQRAWVGLLLNLAQSQAENEEYASAIETLDRLRTADPTNETALQHLMMLLTQRDRRGEALQVYKRHQEMLERDYESEPLPETIELYEKLRNGHVPALYTQKTESAPITEPLEEIQPLDLTFTRPLFQLGRHYQSRLIGREREIQTLRQVMRSLEKKAARPATSTSKDHPLLPPGTRQSQFPPSSASRPRHTHFVLLRGEPGIGKTRLAEELSLEAYQHGWTVAWSRSYEQESTIPYHPWTDLLRTLCKSTSILADITNRKQDVTTDMMLRELAASPLKLERLGTLLPDLQILQPGTGKSAIPISLEQERLHLWEAVLGLIETFSKQHPLLLVLDDLHWADDSSIDLLTYLIHHLQEQSVLLIGTCREGELAPQHKLRTLIADLQREQAVVVVPVLPLTSTQIGTLVAHLPQNLVESIQSQAAGNPFFAEELARYVDISANEQSDASKLGALTTLDATPPAGQSFGSYSTHQKMNGGATQPEPEHQPASISLPEAIAAVLERRLGRLSQGCQQLLGKAAVIGGSFELRQLVPMAGDAAEDTVLDLLDEALNAGLLIEEGAGANIAYHFWHPLIISHLYSRLSAARRAQLHRRAAETLIATSSSQPEKAATTIVYHLSKGGGDRETLAYYAEISANQAYGLAAYTEAQQYYILVFQALSGNEFTAANQINAHHYIQHIIARDCEQLPFHDPLHLCRILERIAECSIILGSFADGRQVYEYILHLRTCARFERYLSMELAISLEEVEELRKKEAQIQAMLWREIGNTWTYTSEYEPAYRCYERGKAAMVQAGITSGAAWACLHLQYGALFRLEGDYTQARRYLQEALTMLEEVVQTPHLPYQRMDIMREPGVQTRRVHDLSLTRIERALTGDPLEIGYAHERLGIVAVSLGEVNSALEHLDVALTIYEQSELVSEMVRVCGNLGAVNIVKGAHDEARRYMQRALELAERSGDIPNMTFITHNLGDVAQRSGSLREAEGWFKRSLELGELINDRERLSWSYIALTAIQADMGNLEEATNSIRRAISISRAIKSTRCIRYALLGLADLRITQAIATRYYPDDVVRNRYQAQLLARASKTLQRSITLEGMEAENIIDAKHSLAMVYFLQGDLQSAHEVALQTLKDAQDYETMRIVERAYRLLGRIMHAQKQPEQAVAYFRQALHICQEHGLRLDYARTLVCYGALLLEQDQNVAPATLALGNDTSDTPLHHRGLHYIEESYQIFRECHAAIDLAMAEHLLSQPALVRSLT